MQSPKRFFLFSFFFLFYASVVSFLPSPLSNCFTVFFGSRERERAAAAAAAAASSKQPIGLTFFCLFFFLFSGFCIMQQSIAQHPHSHSAALTRTVQYEVHRTPLCTSSCPTQRNGSLLSVVFCFFVLFSCFFFLFRKKERGLTWQKFSGLDRAEKKKTTYLIPLTKERGIS